MTTEPQWRPAAWAIMRKGAPDKPIATRATIDEALAYIPVWMKEKLNQGYAYDYLSVYLTPTDEIIEVKP